MATTLRLLASMLSSLAVAAGCGSTTSTQPPPACVEPLLSEGRAYALDPGFALAITTAIGQDHPQVGPIVAGVREYQAAHPDTGVFEPDARDADVASLAYVLLVAAIADESGATDPDLIHTYAQAARERGMTGVYEVLRYQGSTLPDDVWPLSRLVIDQLTAVHQAGFVGASEALDLRTPDCRATDEPG